MPDREIHLVLMPGMDGTGDLFQGLQQALDPGIRTAIYRFAPNIQGSGSKLPFHLTSMVPPAAPYILLAESYSTPIAIRHAATRPPNLKGLVLCAAFATSPVRGFRRWLASLLGPVLMKLPLTNFFARAILVGSAPSPRLLGEVKAAIRSAPSRVLAGRLREVLECDVRAELAEINVPILYLQATGDHLIPNRCMEEIRRIQPTMELATIDGPHLILQREPGQAAIIIKNFAGRLLCSPLLT
jgi:pimeloyl-ACP methyl ester carboxylesterase